MEHATEMESLPAVDRSGSRSTNTCIYRPADVPTPNVGAGRLLLFSCGNRRSSSVHNSKPELTDITSPLGSSSMDA
ncbi:hypothetical protein E2562_006360 [Oryza meyeriana var. granulata]|uniref:Uncharacterized protein n=1 Tax=Oryza meyeriana var. granulata TaxID=110450 RepID=A0A6G1EFL4_9ORYZ|nr:hypothetical protein E2562_006360 [Oryza meyeriana var. granulata]